MQVGAERGREPGGREPGAGWSELRAGAVPGREALRPARRWRVTPGLSVGERIAALFCARALEQAAAGSPLSPSLGPEPLVAAV